MDIRAVNYAHFTHFVICFSLQTITLKSIVIHIVLLCNSLIIAMETVCRAGRCPRVSSP